jgi:DNA primase
MSFKTEIDTFIKEIDLVKVAVDLGCIDSDKVNCDGATYRGNCPKGHQSNSESCCCINGYLGHCFNCGYGFGPIQLVQDIKFGERTKRTFWDTLDFLSTYSSYELNIKKEIKTEVSEDYTVFEILTSASNIFHEKLLENKDVLGICKELWGLNLATIKKFKIGFSLGDGLFNELKTKGFDAHDIISTGLFMFHSGQPVEFFNKRITFPYLYNGLCRYFVARETKFTPKTEYEKNRKYKKLLTYNADKKRTYISKCVQNDVLFNIDSVKDSDEIIITEGVADCINLSINGFSSISPVTVRYRKADLENVLRLVAKKKKIYIANDNEYNSSGSKGALEMALELTKKGYKVSIIEIPLNEERKKIREWLKTIDEGVQK